MSKTIKSFKDIPAAVIEAVIKAERTYGRGKGEQKRQFVVDLVNEFVNIPLLPERYEAVIIGLAVDTAVYCFNWAYGHIWPIDNKNRNVLS